MDVSKKIKTTVPIKPTIYAYTTPDVTYHEGWTKIGYTEKQTPEERIRQQTHTAGIKAKFEWSETAKYVTYNKNKEPEYFKDHDFHSYLTRYKGIKRERGTEWFEVEPSPAHNHFYDFAGRKISLPDEGQTYVLRKEQQQAVDEARDYFKSGGKKFLWNAKPRFGKTLAAYDLIKSLGAEKVLIVTNRPSIANSWREDFTKFVGWHKDYLFVSDSNVMREKTGVLTREEYRDHLRSRAYKDYRDTAPGFIAFESLQGLKGSKYLGGSYDKLHWVKDLDFDLLIIDESHEGVDTTKTFKVLDKIKTKHTLHLSGTPFKAIAEGKFDENEIFNWSYADEQEAKENWQGDDYNPYERLPRLNMFTYQMSEMIEDELKKGVYIDEEDEFVDYAFDLNEFFKTNDRGKFIHEDEVKKFLKALTTGEKYPFSTPQLRGELSHTLWILNRVDSAKALAKLLKKDEIFKDYEIVVAAGDGNIDEEKFDDEESEDKIDHQIKSAYDKVKKAIKDHDKTITLSVGQLTVGVTVPEWSGVLMLSNMKSPASYMQAAFRAQNPHTFTGKDGREYRKENAYVFDFDPARTLTIFDEFANSLLSDTARGGTYEQRKKHIKRLLNFFPVIGEDSEGKMIELDAAKVLSIPRKLKSQEVVKRKFLSNFLFKDIANVIRAPKEIREIIDKLPKAKEEKLDKSGHDTVLDQIDDLKNSVDLNNEINIPSKDAIDRAKEVLGEKYYEVLEETLDESRPDVEALGKAEEDKRTEEVKKAVDGYTETAKKAIIENAVNTVVERSELTKPQKERIKKEVEAEIDYSFNKIRDDFVDAETIVRAEMEHRKKEAKTTQEKEQAKVDYNEAVQTSLKEMNERIVQVTKELADQQPAKAAGKIQEIIKSRQKREVEDGVRAHLRGFSRTIPSFIMAYGDENLKLKNFDDYTEDAVFEEVTGITEEDFRLLRDGFDYEDEKTGETIHYNGFFDEVVFNDSIQEFLNKRQELADYFEVQNAEDIFDYIPPQKTNQIFTPKWIVKKMVDELEKNDPGCFDDPDHTFADLYMKSGLYIAEIVKRLFRNEKMKEKIPDDRKRIEHILEHQVYGMAPSRIIYLIATNYILGFDENLKANTKNFVQADASKAAKEGTLQELVDQYFGSDLNLDN